MALSHFLPQALRPFAPLCLLCEPSPALRAVMEHMLREAGLQVQAFGDAGAFREASTRKTPALVIAQADVLEHTHFPKIGVRSGRPVVLVMASGGGAAEIIRGFAAGADEYIVKPFDGGVLRAKLECFNLLCRAA